MMTSEEIKQLAEEVSGILKTEGKSIGSAPMVDSTFGLTSLPMVDEEGNVVRASVNSVMDLVSGKLQSVDINKIDNLYAVTNPDNTTDCNIWAVTHYGNIIGYLKAYANSDNIIQEFTTSLLILDGILRLNLSDTNVHTYSRFYNNSYEDLTNEVPLNTWSLWRHVLPNKVSRVMKWDGTIVDDVKVSAASYGGKNGKVVLCRVSGTPVTFAYMVSSLDSVTYFNNWFGREDYQSDVYYSDSWGPVTFIDNTFYVSPDSIWIKDDDGHLINLAESGIGRNSGNNGEIFNDYENNEAKGLNAHAEGCGTVANNEAEHAQGKYNVSVRESGDLSQATAFSHGGGTGASDRKNLLELKKNGDLYISGRKLVYDVNGTPTDLIDKIENLSVETPDEPLSLGNLTNMDETFDNCEDGVYCLEVRNGMIYPIVGGTGGGNDTVQRNVRIVNGLESKSVSASKGEPCPLVFTFISQERYGVDESYEDIGERGLCQVSVKTTDGSSYVVVKQMYINSGTPTTVDVAEYLSSGANSVMIKVTGEITEITTPAFVYTVQLTSLSISADNFKWWTAYTGNITLPLNIGGNVSKILYVTLIGQDYNESYQIVLGTGIYTETAYNYALMHPGKSGVYKLSAYVTNSDGTIKTKTISFNIICAVTGEYVKLIAINDTLDKTTNWAENKLFSYTMYDGDSVYTSAQFVIEKNGVTVFSSNEDSVATATKHTFSLPLEIETLDSSDFEIIVHVNDGENNLTEPITFTVNNSSGYSAVAGALFCMNPKTRSNRQDNFRHIINEIDGSLIDCSWSNMNWGNDGWLSDDDGNKALRLMAGSLLDIHHYPFAKECARTGKTIEIDYKVDNVTNYGSPVLTISSASGDSFVGLNIYADEITMHSQSLKNSKVQGIHTHEGKRIRMTLVIMPDAYGNSGFNLCIIYINGKKNREFTYENNDYFAHNGGIIIGSEYADIDIYGIRIYDLALTSPAVLRNYINWLVTTSEKLQVTTDNDVLDSNGSDVDFLNTLDQYNVMVFDNTIPRIADPSTREGTLEVYFYEFPERNVKITNVQVKGQGTSSMRYYLWNTRYSIDKEKSVITYADGTIGQKTWQMIPSIPAGAKFTAKKNYASSMQSHKMGSANSVHDLYKQMGFTNEAMDTEDYENCRIAVYQLPFVCFEKSVNEEGEFVYTFMGEYTFGPDKGDKYTFGYDTDLFPGLISIEGADNSPLLTLFRVPWTDACVKYNPDEEAFQYNGANAWDFDGGSVNNISLFVPAYNLVYSCSNRLKPFDGTLDELNSQVATMRTQPYEFWIAKEGDEHRFNVYYYESGQNRFVPSDIGNGTINLVVQLVDKEYGLTSADLEGKNSNELNELFVKARITKFRKEAPIYWDIDDAILHRNWVEMHAGTDQRAKNTYTYCFGEGCKWKWRYDDMDTIFDTDNEGQPEKSYSVEIHDMNETGAAVWNGETSNFWNLIDLAFPEEVVTGMKNMLTAMEELGGLKSGTDFDKIYAYYQKYYFNPAQEYFPANIVNADAKIAYENGKLAYIAGTYTNDTDPITQSLGDHYSAETRWVTKRIIYIMSKYSFGLFSANGTDNITVRAAGDTIKYELTPAMDLYPAIANGTSIIRGKRTKAGGKCEMLVELSGSGDQQNTIQGASFLEDIGDWHDKNVSGTMVIQGKMLREIRLGSKTDKVLISITALTISNCTSLQKLVLSNITTLGGTLNLAACTHLKEVYADGTSLSQIKLPSGGGLQKVEFSSKNQYLSLSNYPLLANDAVGIDLCKEIITDFFIVDCPLINPMDLLVNVMNAQSDQGNAHRLKRIRAVGFNETYRDAGMLDVLSNLSDGSYSGLSSEGLAGEDEYPVLDGTLNIYASVYEDSVDILENTFKKLKLNVFGERYVRFKDAVLLNILSSNYGDGIGITMPQIKAVTKLVTFEGNTDITSFDEFKYFTNNTDLHIRHFSGCTNLKSISLPDSVTEVTQMMFNDNSNLESVELPEGLVSINKNSFWGCSSLHHIRIPSTVTSFGTGVFDACDLFSIDLPDSLQVIGSTIFRNNANLVEVVIPQNVSEMGNMVFFGCAKLKKVIMKPVAPPVLGGEGVFNSTPSDLKIYVPDESVESYKTATNWTKVAAKIKPMSELTE